MISIVYGAPKLLNLRIARKARDRDDENLLQAMRDSPEGSIGSWAAAIGKSRTSVVSALGRLRDAGLAEILRGSLAADRKAAAARAGRLMGRAGARDRHPRPATPDVAASGQKQPGARCLPGRATDSTMTPTRRTNGGRVCLSCAAVARATSNPTENLRNARAAEGAFSGLKITQSEGQHVQVQGDVAWAMGVVAAGQHPKTGPASEASVFETTAR